MKTTISYDTVTGFPEIGFGLKMKKLIVIAVISVVCLTLGCTGNKDRMLQQLEQLEAANHAGEQLLNDSLAEELVAYFDRHGSDNERMRSRYMLGRTYFFIDELPQALEVYNEAADCADTTSADCNYKVLSRIHAQKVVIFHSQVQPLSQLKELRFAEFYAWKGEDMPNTITLSIRTKLSPATKMLKNTI